MTYTDEVKQAAQTLYDRGLRGNSNAYQGMSQEDEQNLVSIILQTNKPHSLPSIHDVDQKDSIYGMLARYITHSNPESAQNIADYLKNSFIDHFRPTIQQIMSSFDDGDEAQEARRQLAEDIASYDNQRL